MLGEMQFKGTWRDYQARVLDEFEQHFGDERLHIVAAPGAGKTVLGLEIIRRIGRPALVFAPTIAIREQAKAIIGAEDFLEVFVDTPLEECERRDVKGLYAKARAGEVKDFTGISAPFEAPATPDIRIATSGRAISACTQELYERILPRVKHASTHA